MWRQAQRMFQNVVRRLRPIPETERFPSSIGGYERIYKSIQPDELYDDPSPLDGDELAMELFDSRQRPRRFLGFYSEHGGRMAFERYGFLDRLRKKGFDPHLTVDFSDPDDQRLRCYDGEPHPDKLLIELAATLRHIRLPNGTSCRVLFIHWLLMQNPRATFPDDEPALPDQRFPGLGLFLHFGQLLRLMAIRTECDGLMNHPAHFHNGVLYGKVMQFVDPLVEGRFQAMRRDLRDLSLARATRSLEADRVRDQDGELVQWEALPQMMPISPAARAWFESPAYRATVTRTLGEVRVHLDSEALAG